MLKGLKMLRMSPPGLEERGEAFFTIDLKHLEKHFKQNFVYCTLTKQNST
jgi:hypothetical protein